MYLSDAVRDRIRFYQKQKGMSLWGLFKASGVPMSTLAAFMSKRTELIKLDTLLHICEGFGLYRIQIQKNLQQSRHLLQNHSNSLYRKNQ